MQSINNALVTAKTLHALNEKQNHTLPPTCALHMSCIYKPIPCVCMACFLCNTLYTAVYETHNTICKAHPFSNCCRHLRLQSSYEEAISNVLSMGGDTDTNAAIVGGLVGALHGHFGIPRYMKEPMLARDSNSPGIPRPEFLTTRTLPKVCQQLYELAGQRAGIHAVPVSHAATTPGVFNCGSCFLPSVRRFSKQVDQER